MNEAYVGRLAPSPTGLLHLGHAATFFSAYDRARAHKGRLLLRIDDLDRQRSKGIYVEAAQEDLRWLGITWDDEFRESHRLGRYRDAVAQLLARDLAYPCTCSRKDLQQAIQAPHEDIDDEPVYSGRCRPDTLRPAKQASDDQSITVQLDTNYRFRVPDGEHVRFSDGNCGSQGFTAGQDFGDFLVWRKDGLPSYQLATVVDDADTHVTEVVRGRDLLKSTARQVLLQRALGYREPHWFHTDLLRDETGQRLAKRHDALSLRTLRDMGVTPAGIRARVDALLHHSKM